ncbi:hypothetical protein JL37_24660 [Achromobacter sp. RTa]|uniref:hypothetical protein n=1 Tax=Achromobacter sp. RTa TaxID=1532557 RepID=UPI00050F6B80|nr:hypothetical protein [Achromobacter sp. RTa]KGD87776.1 hypothetical protein JL37_24660 [Achromobacter sp. RTa]
MAIDAEPKDGDFARYIENLTRAGGATPGRVPPKRQASRRAAEPVPPSVPAPAPSSESLSTAPWGKSAPQPLPSRSDAAAPAAPAPGQEDPAAASLADRARRRKIGIILTVAGALAGWAAARIVFEVLRNPRFDMDELMPAVFLAFFAFMLFKAAGSARNPRKTPLEKLPPLKPSSYRKDGGA